MVTANRMQLVDTQTDTLSTYRKGLQTYTDEQFIPLQAGNPVTVNGYSCKNCTEVDEAKKHIDPAHPKDGPYGVNADRGAAVSLGGALASLNVDQTKATSAGAPYAPGSVLNLAA